MNPLIQKEQVIRLLRQLPAYVPWPTVDHERNGAVQLIWHILDGQLSLFLRIMSIGIYSYEIRGDNLSIYGRGDIHALPDVHFLDLCQILWAE